MTHKKYLSNAAVETLRATSLQPKIILLIFLILFSLSTHAQTRAISLSVKNEPIKIVLAEIQQKSGYRILYNDEVVPDELRVSINTENVSVKTVLETFLANTDLTFLMQSDDLIVITKKEFTRSADEIFGTVVDENNEPVPFANVVQIALPDSTFINGVSTGANGRFSLKRETADSVLLEITFLGYERFQTEVAQNNMGTIRLNPETTLLGEVTVTASAPQYRLKGTALNVNVANSTLSTLGTANDVLSQLPFVIQSGNSIQVIGKGKPLIYLNNRLLRNEKELEQISSRDIQEVEINTSPGPEYDATVNAVIKIRTVRKQGDGLSGYFMVYPYLRNSGKLSHVETANLNYRTGRLDVFSSLTYMDINAKQEQTTVTQMQSDVHPLHRDMSGSSNFHRQQFIDGSVGLNFEINKHNSIGAKYTHIKTFKNTTLFTGYDKYYRNNVLQDSLLKDSYFDGGSVSHHANMYYLGKIAEKVGVDINVDYSSGETDVNQSVNYESAFNSALNDGVISHNDYNYNMYAGKAILNFPLFTGEMKIGGEYINSQTKQLYVNEKDELQEDLPNTTNRSNQSTFGAFASFAVSFGKVKTDVGVRYEVGDFKYYVNNALNDDASRIYQNVFPSLSVSFPYKKTNMSLSFKSSTQRPTYYQLRSHTQFNNPYSYEGGNPELKPTIQSSITYMCSYKDLNVMAVYNHYQNPVIFVLDRFRDKEDITISTFYNFPYKQELITSVSWTPTIAFWKPRMNVSFVKPFLQYTYNNQLYKYNHPYFQFRLNNQFELPSEFIFGLNISGRTYGNSNVNYTKPYFGVNANIRKSFFNQKLDVLFGFYDIFNTNKSKWGINYKDVQFKKNIDLDNRYAILQLTYRFNSATSKYKGTGAGSSERDRL